MPTGYTAKIAEGISFNDYAMSCARAFGALIEMRDEPQGAPIPEVFEPSDYHRNAINKAVAELIEARKMLSQECTSAAIAEHNKLIADAEAAIESKKELKAKYEAMLNKCLAYKSPSSEHDEFKKFMCDQIKESIKFDCGTEFWEEYLNRPLVSGLDWKKVKLEECERSIAYHREQLDKEVERCRERTQWVKLLRQSLNGGAK